MRHRLALRRHRLAWAWLVACGGLAGVAVLAAPARAQSGPALHWVRGPGAEVCIPPAELARAVEARLGAPIFATATDAELAVEGHITPIEPGFRALLQVSDREGHVLGSRTLESPHANCRALDEALILVIVLTLDPEAGLLGAGIALPDDVQARLDDALSSLDQAIETGQVPESNGPPVVRAVPAARPARAPAAPPRNRWSLAAFGGLSFGATPSLSWLAGLRAGFQPGGLPLFELSALMVGPSSAEVDRTASADGVEAVVGDPAAEPLATGGTTAEVGAWVAALALHVCLPRGPEPRVRLRLCGGLEGGLMRGWAEGFVHDSSHFYPHVALSTAGALELPLGRRWLLSAEVGGLLPLTRPEFVYETSLGGNRSVFLTSPVIGRTLLSLGLLVD